MMREENLFLQNLSLFLVSMLLATTCARPDDTGTSLMSQTETPLASNEGMLRDRPDTPLSSTDLAVDVSRIKPNPSYNLIPAILTSSTELYALPNRPEFIAEVPARETIYILGRSHTDSHLRVLWNTVVGWIPVTSTGYNHRQDKLDILPVFTGNPESCTEPLASQIDLNSTWISQEEQTVVVVVDLFRFQYGEFPPSSLSLRINGEEVENSRVQILGKGQFLLIHHQFGPISVKPGDTVAYLFRSTSGEEVKFMSVIIRLPMNCLSRFFSFFTEGFDLKHLTERLGEQVTETVSYQTNKGLDNSDGTSPLQVQIQFERPYHYQIIEQLNTEEISTQRVREEIVHMYHLPPNDPEGTQQTALCPLSVVIPVGQKAIITVEWIERWAEGVVLADSTEGDAQLGTYSVFLGYVEPCSLINQENMH